VVALNPKRVEITIAGYPIVYPSFPGDLLENLDIFKVPSYKKTARDSDELPYFALKYTREESEMIHKISASDSGKERALQQGEECRL
jgi:hypothetical protein